MLSLAKQTAKNIIVKREEMVLKSSKQCLPHLHVKKTSKTGKNTFRFEKFSDIKII